MEGVGRRIWVIEGAIERTRLVAIEKGLLALGVLVLFFVAIAMLLEVVSSASPATSVIGN